MDSTTYTTVSYVPLLPIISQLKGSFLNQTISVPISVPFSVPFSVPLYDAHLIDGVSYPLEEYFYIMWMVMFCLSCFSMGLFMYRCFSFVFRTHSDVVDDMRTMMNEISNLSERERQEQGENYYILTNLLVNRFRIEVYEKILK
jgi:hypothetical protein